MNEIFQGMVRSEQFEAIVSLLTALAEEQRTKPDVAHELALLNTNLIALGKVLERLDNRSQNWVNHCETIERRIAELAAQQRTIFSTAQNAPNEAAMDICRHVSLKMDQVIAQLLETVVAQTEFRARVDKGPKQRRRKR